MNDNLHNAIANLDIPITVEDEMNSVRWSIDQDDREDFEPSEDLSDMNMASGSTVKLLFQSRDQAKTFMENMYHHYGYEYCTRLQGTPDKFEYDFSKLLIRAADD
jgi:hypothetical protein